MIYMKNFNAMNKKELLAIYAEFDLLPPEEDKPTNEELVDMLESHYELTAQKVKQFREKKDAELKNVSAKDGTYSPYAEDGNGTVVICMDRANASFQIGKYTFTQRSRYQPVDAETADALLSRYTGFRKATREELKRNIG